jgi:DNA (cytosine-5)-methyltransferase 1
MTVLVPVDRYRDDVSTASTRAGKAHSYGVRLVRGPFVNLAPHAEHTDDTKKFLAYAARLRSDGARLAADFFSGAGGLSLGLEKAGRAPHPCASLRWNGG